MANSKELYCEALLRMCETQRLGKITVTSLIKETGTARQTFYNNFRDINDLVSFIPIHYLTQAECLSTQSRTYAMPSSTPSTTRASSANCQTMQGKTTSGTPS